MKSDRKLYKQRETRSVRALRGLGLDDAETRTYLALVRLGSASVAAAARAAGLRRSVVHAALGSLQRRGLAGTFPRGKRMVYAAESPARLREIHRRAGEMLEGMLPGIENMYRRPGGMPVMRMIQGVEAIRDMHDRMVHALPKGGAYYRFSSPKFEGGERKYLSRTYKRIRDAKDLQRFIITNLLNAKRKKPDLDREIRVIPEGKHASFAYNVTLITYADTVELVDYNSDVAIIIEDTLVAAFVRHLFLILYDQLPAHVPKRTGVS